MKRLELKKFITCSLIITTITSTTSIITKAQTVSQIYKEAYNSTMKVVDIGKKYNVIPRHANNNTSIESNSIDTIYKAVKDGNMQKAINQAREYITELPADQWQAKNTFSNILDGYQQPSYEHIVDMVLKLDKITKKCQEEFDYSSNWDSAKKEQFCNTIKQLQSFIEIARALNNGVDPAYGNAYSSALDKPQQVIINMVNDIITQARKTQSISDVNFAEEVVKVFKDNISETSNIKEYANQLQSYVDSLKILSEFKAKLDDMSKEIAALKDNRDEVKNAINEINAKLKDLQNQGGGGGSTTVIQVPEALKKAVKDNYNAIKDLQKKVDILSELLGQQNFNPDKNKQLFDEANTSLDNFNKTPNNDTLQGVNSSVRTFLNYDFIQNREDHKKIYKKMYDIANPIAEDSITNNDLNNLVLVRGFLTIAIQGPSFDACYNKDYDIQALYNKVVNKIKELSVDVGYEEQLNKISESIKNINNYSDANSICYALLNFKNLNLNDKVTKQLDSVTDEFYNYLKEEENKDTSSEQKYEFIGVVQRFLDSLREKSPSIEKTEDLVIQYYTKGINKLKNEPKMDYNMVRAYVDTLISNNYFAGNKSLQKICLSLIEDLGNSIINQICNENNYNNENVLNNIIRDLKSSNLEQRKILGIKLKDSLDKNILNQISEDIKNIKTKADAESVCRKLDKFKRDENLSDESITKLNDVTAEMLNCIKQFNNNATNYNERLTFLSIAGDFLNSLRQDSQDKIKTEELVINYYTEGMNKLKNEPTMSHDSVSSYVDPIAFGWYFKDNEAIENKSLELIEDLGNTIIEQISQKNMNNENVIREILRGLKADYLPSTSKRYILGEKLEKKLNEALASINNISKSSNSNASDK